MTAPTSEDTGRRGAGPARRWLSGMARHRAAATALAAVLVVVVAVVSGPFQQWLEHRDRAADLEARVVAIETANEQLQERVEELGDPDLVERTVREELGMVRPGEVPYVVVPPQVDEVAAPPAEPADERGWLRRVWDALSALLSG